MPRILLAALIARAELVALDDAALQELTRYYEAIWDRLQGQFDRITRLIEEAVAAGRQPILRIPGSGAILGPDEFSANWLFRQTRYYELMAQLEAEMARLGMRSVELITKQQRNGLLLGLDHGQTLSAQALPANAATIGYVWNRVPLDALENMIGFLRDGSPLTYKFAGLAPDVAEAVKQSLVTGIATGQNPRRIAAEAKRASSGSFLNVLTTCRTETLRAYRTACHEQYRANDDVIAGWLWSCAHQSRTCAACWGMDGSFHQLNEEMVDHPAGRCAAIPASKSWAELGFGGVTETQLTSWDPETPFKQMSKAEQVQVLGPRKFEAWRAGDIRLQDIPARVPSDVWGDHYRAKTLDELELLREAA